MFNRFLNLTILIFLAILYCGICIVSASELEIKETTMDINNFLAPEFNATRYNVISDEARAGFYFGYMTYFPAYISLERYLFLTEGATSVNELYAVLYNSAEFYNLLDTWMFYFSYLNYFPFFWHLTPGDAIDQYPYMLTIFDCMELRGLYKEIGIDLSQYDYNVQVRIVKLLHMRGHVLATVDPKFTNLPALLDIVTKSQD